MNPPEPAVGRVLTLNSVGSKPVIAAPLVRMRQAPGVEASKWAALPVTSGDTDASDPRLTLNGVPAASDDSVSEADWITSQPPPAVPVASSICQL